MNIKGYENYTVSKSGEVINAKTGRILHPIMHTKGYSKVYLSKNGASKYFYVHRLVASTYIPNLDNKPQVNHINGQKDDNRVENLEWVTNQENVNHAHEQGLVGTRRRKVFSNENTIISIRKEYQKGKNGYRKLATKYSTSREVIRGIVLNLTYKNVKE